MNQFTVATFVERVAVYIFQVNDNLVDYVRNNLAVELKKSITCMRIIWTHETKCLGLALQIENEPVFVFQFYHSV